VPYGITQCYQPPGRGDILTRIAMQRISCGLPVVAMLRGLCVRLSVGHDHEITAFIEKNKHTNVKALVRALTDMVAL